MASSSAQKPPKLSECKSYDDWIKLINIWTDFVTLDKSKHAQAIVLQALEGEARDAALEIESAELSAEDGVKKVMERLDKLYKKDELTERYNAIDALDAYRRPKNTTMKDFLIEFDKRLYKAKSYKSTMSDDLLAYRLLKAANLDDVHEQLIKATVPELKYEGVRKQLKKIFSDEDKMVDHDSEKFKIKIEPTYFTNNDIENESSEDEEQYYSEGDLTLFSRRGHPRGSYNHPRQQSRQANSRFRTQKPYSNKGNVGFRRSDDNNWRNPTATSKSTPRNPTDFSGNITRCVICESINHWADKCPDKNLNVQSYQEQQQVPSKKGVRFEEQEQHQIPPQNNNQQHDTLIVHEVILFENKVECPNQLKQLVSETWGCGLLDSGASKI